MANQIVDEILNVDYTGGYPIFDNRIQDLARTFYSQPGASNPNFDNLNEMFVAKEFILRLPNIDLLTFSEIINVKEELYPALNKFKGLINSYSEEIKGFSFDPDNKIKIEKKYNYDFLPQLKEVQENIESNRMYKLLFKELSENLTKYSIYIGVGAAIDIKGLLLGGGASTIESTIRSYNKMKDKNKEIRNSAVYFYHDLSSR
jgi:hypothetical protein